MSKNEIYEKLFFIYASFAGVIVSAIVILTLFFVGIGLAKMEVPVAWLVREMVAMFCMAFAIALSAAFSLRMSKEYAAKAKTMAETTQGSKDELSLQDATDALERAVGKEGGKS